MKKNILLKGVLSFICFIAGVHVAMGEVDELTVESNLPKVNASLKNPVERSVNASALIDGEMVDYLCEASVQDLVMKDECLYASIFSVSYIVKNSTTRKSRPVVFAFNGGPGSSSAWLHLGALGPKIIPTSKDGIRPHSAVPGEKAEALIDNPNSILDVADLVFIDAPTTGFSRIGKESDQQKIHSYKGDAQIMAVFVDQWIKNNDRGDSPIYIIGESYGAIRAIGVCDLLQRERGINLNGLVLLSGLIDMETVIKKPGNIRYYTSHLPSYAMAAHHHGLIKGEVEMIYKKAYHYAYNDYRLALEKGMQLTAGGRYEVVRNIKQLTGLSEQMILYTQLRPSPGAFRLNVMGRPARLLGRYDSRVSKALGGQVKNLKNADPSYDMMKRPLQLGMKKFLTEMQWTGTEKYRLTTDRVKPWDYGVKNGFLDVSQQLETSISGNKKLKILVQSGRYDLATPPAGIHRSISRLRLTDEERSRISEAWYDAGHMFYFKQASLEKSRNDLIQFMAR